MQRRNAAIEMERRKKDCRCTDYCINVSIILLAILPSMYVTSLFLILFCAIEMWT